jgi:long-chain fatty acid transport protein
VNGNGSIPPNFGGGEANIQLQENMIGIAYGRKL